MYLTTPIAMGFTLLFGPHLALTLLGLRNFSSIANPGSIKPFLSVCTTWKKNQHCYLTSNRNISSAYKVIHRFLAYRISFFGDLFMKWVKGKKIIIQGKEFSREISIQKM